MNKRQVITLWVIALLLGAAVAAVKLSQNHQTRGATQRVQGETLFKSFPAAEVAEISLNGATESVTLVKNDDKWTVRDRNDFPANTTFVNSLIRTLSELKVTLGVEAGPSFAPRFGMDENSKISEEHGLVALFKDASGKELAKIALGKPIDSAASENPMMGGGAVGRYIRNFADESGFYAISEMFPSVSADPKRWLADGFISPEKIESISVSDPGKSDVAWKITREGEEAEFKLDGAQAAEVLDTTVTAPLKGLFSYARFEDIVPPDKVGDRIVEGQSRSVTIQTFEGFTYTVKLSPTKAPETPAKPDENQDPLTGIDNFLMTVDVAAELPKERKKEEGEKPEDAKTKDAAFTERLKTLTDKLAKEKALAGVTFEISKTSVESLLKDRKSIIAQAKPAAPGAPGSADAPSVRKFPGGVIAAPPSAPTAVPGSPTERPPISATTPPIEAVTPPIQVPAADDQDADSDVDDESDDEDQ